MAERWQKKIVQSHKLEVKSFERIFRKGMHRTTFILPDGRERTIPDVHIQSWDSINNVIYADYYYLLEKGVIDILTLYQSK